MTLTRVDVEAAFRQLELGALTPPAAWDAAVRLEVAAQWQRDLGLQRRPSDLTAAVGAYLRSGSKYWPTPGQLLAHFPYGATRDDAPRGRSWEAPDPRDYDWYALGSRDSGPLVRLLSHAEARRRGLTLAQNATCPVEGCDCGEAVEIRWLSASAWLGVFGRALQDQHPRQWVWPHHALTLAATAYTVVHDRAVSQ